MKTPSSLALLLLFAALPAAADVPAGARCDVAWLEATQATMSKPGGAVSDADRIEVVSNFVKLKFGSPKTCDAATWRQLATVEPINGEVIMDPRTHQPVGGTALKWRNRAAGDFWKDTAIAQHIGLVLTVNDFYAAIDAKGKAVSDAGDAVIDAAKALGFADFTASDKSLGELAKNTSGGPVGALKPRVVTVFAEGKQVAASVAPDQLGPTMRKLVNDGPTLGDSVVAFRVAVLALNAELGRLGKSDALLKKRVSGATPGLTDFTSGLPQGYVAATADKATALAEDKYGAALTALIGPGTTPAFGDQGLRGAALLDPVDQGLRNLVAVRSAEVDKIYAAAKKRLAGRTIGQYETSARAATTVKDLPKDSLAAAVFSTLSQTPEYQRLDALYENNKRDKGDAWVNSPEGQAMAGAREDLKQAALSAKIEVVDGKKAVVFTQGGRKTVLGSLVPSAVETDEASRGDAAAIISRFIIDGALNDAKYQAVVAAIAGSGQPGGTVNTGLKAPEIALSKDLPPAIKKIKDGAAGCDTPKDLVRNDYETYAARQRAAASEMAGANVRSRNDVEKKRLEQLAASDVTCKQKKDAAAAIKQDYFDDPAIAKAAREKAAGEADAWCVADKKAIEDAAQARIRELAALEAGDRDPAKLRAKADADLAAAFAVAIGGSVEKLRSDYTTAGNARLKKLAAGTGNSPKLTFYTTFWFARDWPTDASKKTELEAAVAVCAKALGLGDAKSSPSYKNPDDADNVDKYCKVNENLTKYILVEAKGSNRPAP
jgi:hypothetical protein